MTPPLRGNRQRPSGVWGAALSWMDWVAQPALAGIAVTLLGLGVVTWLPALAAAAVSLDRWRRDGDPAVFTGTLVEFGSMWLRLWRAGVGCGLALVVLAVDIVFLLGRPQVWAQALAAVLIGIVLALATWMASLAVLCGTAPEESSETNNEPITSGTGVVPWSSALALAFRRPSGLLITATMVLAGVALLPTGIGPVLFGPSVPLLVGRWVLLRHRRTPLRRRRSPTR